MEIDQPSDLDITSLSATACTDRVQSEARVKLLKKSFDLEKDMMTRLLKSMGIGKHVDTVA